MRNDQIFVLLLVILLPMTGCFDGAVGDAEGTDDASENDAGENGDTTGGEGTSTGTASSTQARTWYSSGGTYDTYWEDGHYTGYYTNNGDVYMGTSYEYDNNSHTYRYISQSSERCINWGPYYDSSTGELLGERCSEWGYPESESEWNLTDCTDSGGELLWYEDGYDDVEYRYAPQCKMSFATINLTAGEALLIYEWYGFSVASTCDGVVSTTSSYLLDDKEYVIAPGTALECSHEIYKIRSYNYNYNNVDYQSIWSIVYAIQDTTVV